MTPRLRVKGKDLSSAQPSAITPTAGIPPQSTTHLHRADNSAMVMKQRIGGATITGKLNIQC